VSLIVTALVATVLIATALIATVLVDVDRNGVKRDNVDCDGVGCNVELDVVGACAGIAPKSGYKSPKPVWEMIVLDLYSTLNINAKGVANMIFKFKVCMGDASVILW
jgi:hypothetical protein